MSEPLLEETRDDAKKKTTLMPSDVSLEDAVRKEGKCCPWGAGTLFPCLPSAIHQIVEEANHIPDGIEGKEFSLIHFKDPMQDTQEPWTEIHDVWRIEDPAAAANALVKVKEHLDDIVGLVMKTGSFLWLLVNLSGFFAYKWSAANCKAGPPLICTVFLVLGVLTQAYQLHWLTLRLSRLQSEGRPMIAMIRGFTGLDSYRLMCVFAVLDMLGRFSRAQFVGYAIACDDSLNDELYASFEKSSLSFLTPFIKAVDGLGGLAAISWLVGPILFTQGFAAHCWCVVKDRLGKDTVEEWNCADCMDELGALAQWAMLDPAGKVLQKAALPDVFEDDNDTVRVWEATRTKAFTVAAKLIPDNVIQMQLQARFLALAFPCLADQFWTGKMALVASFALTAGDAVFSSLDLIVLNMRLPVLLGFLIVLMSAEPITRVAAAFYCPSAVWNMADFSCAVINTTKALDGCSGMIPTL